MSAKEPIQIPLREEMDALRARLWAESGARVFAATAAEARSAVAQQRRTPAQAFAVARRRYNSLRAEYFSRRSPWGTPEAQERDWQESGPAREYQALYNEFFPPITTRAEGRSEA